ncbi:MAG: SIS domain-containing protein [Elusimicrobia bacterium]|nr:SIS domain-containing protein [Elusimicrobiota bacterium]
MSPNKKPLKGTRPGQTHVTGPGGLDPGAFAGWYRERSLEQWNALDVAAVARLAEAVARAERDGRQVLVMGNGGSAATASHIATDWCKTASVPGRRQVKCLSLADNASFITAIGNDLSFDDIFSRQLENILERGDLVVLVSGSGNSPNLLKAAACARSRGAKTAALLGFDGGKLRGAVDLPVLVASDQYGVIEDLHLAIGHIVTFFLKQR